MILDSAPKLLFYLLQPILFIIFKNDYVNGVNNAGNLQDNNYVEQTRY